MAAKSLPCCCPSAARRGPSTSPGRFTGSWRPPPFPLPARPPPGSSPSASASPWPGHSPISLPACWWKPPTRRCTWPRAAAATRPGPLCWVRPEAHGVGATNDKAGACGPGLGGVWRPARMAAGRLPSFSLEAVGGLDAVGARIAVEAGGPYRSIDPIAKRNGVDPVLLVQQVLAPQRQAEPLIAGAAQGNVPQGQTSVDQLVGVDLRSLILELLHIGQVLVDVLVVDPAHQLTPAALQEGVLRPQAAAVPRGIGEVLLLDRKSTRLNSSHVATS